MLRLIKKKDVVRKKIADTYDVYEMLTKKHSKQMSMCISKARKHSETALNTKSDRFYYILKGSVKIKSGRKTITAKSGDLIFISANTKYYFSGTFEAVQVLSPPFDLKNEPLGRNF